MSNYEPIIEQNNTELQSNNTDLQGLLDTINALPVAENLDTALDDQESLIDQIQAVLEGKAGASAPSVETCTFVFNLTDTRLSITQALIPCYVDGMITTYVLLPFDTTLLASTSVPYVICGSTCYFLVEGTATVQAAEGVERVGSGNGAYYYKITAPAGGTATVNINYLDV